MAYRGAPQLTLPPGWLDCPPYGKAPQIAPNLVLKVIPSKVPLSYDYANLIPPNKSYTLREAVERLDKQGIKIGLVLDLTNSFRYYRFHDEIRDADKKGILYCKVPCRGKGQSPQPNDVNQAVYHLWTFRVYQPDKYALVHCTHGFNRTGYVIVSAMVRLMSEYGMTVERAIRRFAESRAPGIYKDGYIADLFKYHHERRDVKRIMTPPVPSWKGQDARDDEEEGAEDAPPPPPGPPGHDKIFEIGEPMPEEEASYLLGLVSKVLLPERPDIKFPGSQPVSLDRRNLQRIFEHRYWVTWKADGTRYMMLIDTRGCYLIDRAGNMARVQMRFPSPHHHKAPPGKRLDYPVGRPHNLTLLDGEMVVDHDKETGEYKRRYLIYDIMLLDEKTILTQAPFVERYKVVHDAIVAPRHAEMLYIQKYMQKPFDPKTAEYNSPPLSYLYQEEPFSVRRKEFYPLHLARKLITNFIPKLSHEADGLILQPAEDWYRPLTCHELLKWKFAHLNSVDFKLSCVYDEAGQLTDCQLLLMAGNKGGRGGGRGGGGGPSGYSALEDVAVHFPDDIDPRTLDGRIIECTWDNELSKWKFLRVREDKTEPNAAHVYGKVVDSIRDNIEHDELLGYLEACFLQGQVYEPDRAMVRPDQMPAMPLPPGPPPHPDQQHQEDGQEAGGHGQEWDHHQGGHHPQQGQQGWGEEQGQGHAAAAGPRSEEERGGRAGAGPSGQGHWGDGGGGRGGGGRRGGGRGGGGRGGRGGGGDFRDDFLTGVQADAAPRGPFQPDEPDSRVFHQVPLPESPPWQFHHEPTLDGDVLEPELLQGTGSGHGQEIGSEHGQGTDFEHGGRHAGGALGEYMGTASAWDEAGDRGMHEGHSRGGQSGQGGGASAWGGGGEEDHGQNGSGREVGGGATGSKRHREEEQGAAGVRGGGEAGGGGGRPRGPGSVWRGGKLPVDPFYIDEEEEDEENGAVAAAAGGYQVGEEDEEFA